jgi:hypothetical protein
LHVVDYVISSSEDSGSKLYATNPISLELLSITEFQKMTSLIRDLIQTNFGFIVCYDIDNENMKLFMKILQGLMLKHVYILLISNFTQNMYAAMFPLSVTSFRVPSVEQIICFCENRKS